MQTMNTDQQTYFPNPTGPHPATAGYYIPNGIEPRKFYSKINLLNILFYFIFIDFSVRNPNAFASTSRMPQQVKTK